ncbi:ABC transporter ATP-binding protein [Vallitalea pronyensis]|uniref:ABC transporter ATP-binding protein n=1 Tax=Vallitalea pronyensis TaxID=1348613 RepID=A0A8J8SG43_9FIRM|nr:ABC transporter ATP-binding protein [Vallitalea pronyensis]QUI21913.1 ABC transporter ATP-binding protein [Vallitalea pronyensis]
MKTIKKMIRVIKQHPIRWIVGILGYPVTTLVARLIYAYGFKEYVNKLEESGITISDIVFILGLVFVGLLVANLLEYITAFLIKLFRLSARTNIQQEIYTKMQHGSVMETSVYDNGEALTRYNKDSDLAAAMVSDDVVASIYPIIVGLGYIVSIFLVNIYIGLMVFVLGTLIIFFNKYFVERHRKLNRMHLHAESNFMNLYQNTIRGKISIRLINAGEKISSMLEDRAEALKGVEDKIGKLESYKIITLDLFTSICATLMIPVACLFSARGYMSIPEVILVTQLCRDIVVHISGFGRAVSNLKSHEISLDRVIDMMDIDDENNQLAFMYQNDSEPLLRYENVGVFYGEKCIVDHVNLDFCEGEIVMFCGQSGCGKTSLMKALLGFADYTGKILFKGVDIRDFSIQELRKEVSYVPEKSDIFEGTVIENVLYGDFEANDEQIMEALSKAAIYEELAFDYAVGAEGMNLSGGQKQRVAIARSLLKEASVIILDEPTAALDGTSEKIILETLKELRDQGKCIIAITHRESTLAIADRVINM